MKSLLISIFSFTTIACHGQSITPEETSKHINDSIDVCGVVKEVHFIKKNDTYTVYLEFGDRFPNESFSVYLSDAIRKKAPYDLHTLEGKSICILGKIKMRAKKPQIILYNYNQIQK